VTREQTLARLAELQRQVRELREATEIPSLERTMHILDMYCHMARWELGDITAMIPELESEGASTAPSDASPRTRQDCAG
jgi:hypothetical protein